MLFFQARDFSDDAQSDPVQTIAREDDEQAAERVKRPGLIKMRRQEERKGSALMIPYAVIVAGGDVESVMARAEVGVVSHAPVAGFYPLFVPTFQTIPE